MSRLKRGITLLKKGIRNPRLILKGIRYFFNHGSKGVQENLEARLLYDQAIAEITEEEKQLFDGPIKFSVLMPVYNVEVCWLQEAIDSVKSQTYQNWELCIADDCSKSEEIGKFLKEITDERIKIHFCEKNGGIAEASNRAADLSTGDYLILLDHDDVIAPTGLAEFYYEIRRNRPDILYSDQDIIDENNKKSNPLLKPDWSPDLLMSQMYIGHLLGFKKELFLQVGGFRSAYNGSQDYDLLLRMVEQTDRISHVAKILYSWRSLPSSTAENPEAKPYAQTAGRNALQDHLDRKLGKGQARAEETEYLFVYDVRYIKNAEDAPMVSIIIPTKDHIELLDQAIHSIEEKTEYENYEILILNNNSTEKATKDGFKKLEIQYQNIKILDAGFPFNWSKLNNFGMRHARGEVFVFLNNDIKIIERQWLQRIVEQAMRPEVGIVGGLLLYEDGTIQHGGVVVGMGGWADHVYGGMKPVHVGTPFISPMVTRNVLASTGACMGISKKRVEEIGVFDETFIICGSDVELCVRAHEKGYFNIYSPYIRMYHYESKTRDAFVPKIDKESSLKVYQKYLKDGDPFYNIRLDYFSKTPIVAEIMPEVKRRIGKIDEIRKDGAYIPQEMRFGEINPYRLRKIQYPRKRLNLLIPSVNTEHVFGGIATALKFFEALCEASGYDRRLIVIDAQPQEEGLRAFAKGYHLTQAEENSKEPWQVVPYSVRGGRSIPVSRQDYFVFTGWWTAHCMQEAFEAFQEETGIQPNLFLYLIQDYEPGFYPWSGKYMLAEATYRHFYPMVAVFNSRLLQEHFEQSGYEFAHSYVFEPVLNEKLKEYLLKLPVNVKKKKQILIYGRPGTQRNAFDLILAALKKWMLISPDAGSFTILSAGEVHADIPLSKDLKVVSLGKLSLEEYANVLAESYAGISLMASPHPSYPPLEMAVFGVKVVTNIFLNKDLSKFHKNIISVSQTSPNQIAHCLDEICNGYTEWTKLASRDIPYVENTEVFCFVKEIANVLGEELKEM